MSYINDVREELGITIDDLASVQLDRVEAIGAHRILFYDCASKEEIKNMWDKVLEFSAMYNCLRHRVVQFRGKLRMAEAQ